MNKYPCMLHIILLREHFSQNVKYWYEIRDVLVPNFSRAVWNCGKFNNASARRALVDWYLSLFVMCKA